MSVPIRTARPWPSAPATVAGGALGMALLILASAMTEAAVPAVSATAEIGFWITFRARATERHRNRDHERSWLTISSKTSGSTGPPTLRSTPRPSTPTA